MMTQTAPSDLLSMCIMSARKLMTAVRGGMVKYDGKLLFQLDGHRMKHLLFPIEVETIHRRIILLHYDGRIGGMGPRLENLAAAAPLGGR
eukprot:3636197-Pleurochrysis_carterae.AAC.3